MASVVKKFLCFGASTTRGYTRGGLDYTPYSGFLKQLVEEYDAKFKDSVEFITAGVNGETTLDMFDRLSMEMEKNKPDCVIFLVALNDCGLCPDEEQEENNEENEDDLFSPPTIFERIVFLNDFAFELGAKKTFLLSIPTCPLDAWNENYKSNKKWINDEIENYATHSDKIVFVQNLKRMNYLELSDDERINIWDDNLHFTPEGYKVLAETIFEAIKPHLVDEI